MWGSRNEDETVQKSVEAGKWSAKSEWGEYPGSLNPHEDMEAAVIRHKHTSCYRIHGVNQKGGHGI